MSADEEKFFNIPVERKIEDLRVIIEKNYTEILNIDFNEDKNIARSLGIGNSTGLGMAPFIVIIQYF